MLPSTASPNDSFPAGRLDHVKLPRVKAQLCWRWMATDVAVPLTVQNEVLQVYRDVGAHLGRDPHPGIGPGPGVGGPKVGHWHVRLSGELL
jgi:hypothetical protein